MAGKFEFSDSTTPNPRMWSRDVAQPTRGQNSPSLPFRREWRGSLTAVSTLFSTNHRQDNTTLPPTPWIWILGLEIISDIFVLAVLPFIQSSDMLPHTVHSPASAELLNKALRKYKFAKYFQQLEILWRRIMAVDFVRWKNKSV